MQFGVSSILQDDLSLWLNLISATRAEVWRYFNDVVLYCRHQMASFEHYWDHSSNIATPRCNVTGYDILFSGGYDLIGKNLNWKVYN